MKFQKLGRLCPTSLLSQLAAGLGRMRGKRDLTRREDLTLPEDRQISDLEAAVVEWVLGNHIPEVSPEYLREDVHRLRVVARCGCGCASVDFVSRGQSDGARPIASAIGKDSHGRECGVIVWGLGGRISGLEVYEHELDSSSEIPRVETLRLFEYL